MSTKSGGQSSSGTRSEDSGGIEGCKDTWREGQYADFQA